MRDNGVETAIERHTNFHKGANPGGNLARFLEMNDAYGTHQSLTACTRCDPT